MKLFRKRYIPDEIIELKDDQIRYADDDIIITTWNCLKPRDDFATGSSCYFLKKGVKISKFYRSDGTLKAWYCDIVHTKRVEEDYVFVDLLADVVVEDGIVKVLDLDELAEAYEKNKITQEELSMALRQVNALLCDIYAGNFAQYQKFLDERGY